MVSFGNIFVIGCVVDFSFIDVGNGLVIFVKEFFVVMFKEWEYNDGSEEWDVDGNDYGDLDSFCIWLVVVCGECFFGFFGENEVYVDEYSYENY